MASHRPERKAAEAAPTEAILRARGPKRSEFVDVFALDGCKTLRPSLRSEKFSGVGIATAARIPITTVPAGVTATIVVRASDKEEITAANLRASTFAQRTKLAQPSD